MIFIDDQERFSIRLSIVGSLGPFSLSPAGREFALFRFFYRLLSLLLRSASERFAAGLVHRARAGGLRASQPCSLQVQETRHRVTDPSPSEEHLRGL